MVTIPMARRPMLPHQLLEKMAFAGGSPIANGVRRCRRPCRDRRRLHIGRDLPGVPRNEGRRAYTSSHSHPHFSAGSPIDPSFFRVDDRVSEAVAGGRPVCALESTIVAHGMPFPENLELAKEVEEILEEHGVVPATVAVKNGVCRVGISRDELEDLARAGEEGRAQKCSTRDLPVIVGRAAASAAAAASEPAQWGATTVASTMKLAHLAGIATFVTGGIGGVHRNGELSMDVSSDLTELGRTPVVVVSAGIKSILDIPRTLEVLETNSVPTLSWQADEFPAFFSPASGIPSPARADSASEIALAYAAARGLGLRQGMLVGVPNRDPAGESVEASIRSALEAAEERGIRGRDVTPYILKTVAETTGGDSLRSNMALVRQNARVGARIAVAIAELGRRQQQ